jgi:hypothetical protein
MTKKRILGCLRVPPGVRLPPIEYHCDRGYTTRLKTTETDESKQYFGSEVSIGSYGIMIPVTSQESIDRYSVVR